MLESDEIGYLDQLHATASGSAEYPADQAERDRCKRRFLDIVFQLWPEVSAAFDEHKHSL